MSLLSLLLPGEEEEKQDMREDEADFSLLPKCKYRRCGRETWAKNVADERATTYEQRRQEAITRNNKHQAVEDKTHLKRKRELLARQMISID